MFKVLILGMLLGLLGAGALVHYAPAVDLHREASLISVQPNGGNAESFHINLPRDRILVGRAASDDSIPPGLEWPQDELIAGAQTEMFKIRDRNDTVIGIASRLANAAEDSDPFIQWVLHFPARGTMFINMDIVPTEAGYRRGTLTAGTRDFALLEGEVREQFETAVEDAEFDVDGRVRLVAMLVGPQSEEE